MEQCSLHTSKKRSMHISCWTSRGCPHNCNCHMYPTNKAHLSLRWEMRKSVLVKPSYILKRSNAGWNRANLEKYDFPHYGFTRSLWKCKNLNILVLFQLRDPLEFSRVWMLGGNTKPDSFYEHRYWVRSIVSGINWILTPCFYYSFQWAKSISAFMY